MKKYRDYESGDLFYDELDCLTYDDRLKIIFNILLDDEKIRKEVVKEVNRIRNINRYVSMSEGLWKDIISLISNQRDAPELKTSMFYSPSTNKKRRKSRMQKPYNQWDICNEIAKKYSEKYFVDSVDLIYGEYPDIFPMILIGLCPYYPRENLDLKCITLEYFYYYDTGRLMRGRNEPI